MNAMIKIYKFSGYENFDVDKLIEWTDSFEVVLITAQTEKLNDEVKRKDYLRAEQLDKMNCYYKENDRENYVISHGLVNKIFSKILGCEEREVIWDYTKKGKPYIINEYGLTFNISHTKGFIVVALSKNSVGVDIEYIDKNFDYKDIVNYSFSASEKTNVNDTKDFYKYWVAKESYLKYKAVGLLQNLESVEIISECESEAVIRDKTTNKIKAVEIKEITGDYIVAICF